MRLSLSLLAVLLLALAAAGCGGDSGPSKEEQQAQAQTTVCTARSDIEAQVTTLKGLTPNLASVTQIQASVKAIVADLGKIKDAQADLKPDARQQVEQANKAFTDKAKAVGKAAVSGGLSGDVTGQLKPAITQLEATYREVFTPIAC
jgi:PBP1b-binding outer membrane lipoprotein LpoB